MFLAVPPSEYNHIDDMLIQMKIVKTIELGFIDDSSEVCSYIVQWSYPPKSRQKKIVQNELDKCVKE